MRKKNYFKYIQIIAVIIFLNFSNNAYSENLDKLYKKIDLFSEVLEKMWSELIPKERLTI